jgi:hypothetical protein
MFFTNNYEYERLRTKTPEKLEPIRIPDNLIILTGQLWKQVQDDSMIVQHSADSPLFPVPSFLFT